MKLAEIGVEREQQSLESLFQIEFDKVFENIMDKRTFSAGKRKIQINVVLMPSDERDSVIIAYDIKTTLTPITGGYIKLDIAEYPNGNYETRPSISSHRIPGQVDFRDIPIPDEDGVYSEDEK